MTSDLGRQYFRVLTLEKTWLFLLILLLNHMQVASVVAGLHVSSEKHHGFELPHFHVGELVSNTDAPEPEEPSHESVDHSKTPHIHFGFDLYGLPLHLESPTSSRIEFFETFEVTYTNLSYKPPVPPPTA